MSEDKDAYLLPKGTTTCPHCGNAEGLLLQVRQPTKEVECVMCRTWPAPQKGD